jgi:acetamidase/formamidase
MKRTRMEHRTLFLAPARLRNFDLWTTTLMLLVMAGLPCSIVHSAEQTAAVAADHTLLAQPEHLSWGWFPLDKEPALRIQSGDTVAIDTLTHVGATQSEDPVAYLGGLGVPADEVLPDLVEFWESRLSRAREGRSGHVITGPIHIEGAEPGDTLEIQILDVQPRVRWGANNTGPQRGVLSSSYPGFREGDRTLDIPNERHVIWTDEVNGRQVALFAANIHVPLAPFMGIMAVAPEPVVGEPGVTVSGVQSSTPPGAFGGNMDVKDLKAGATLFLPVFQSGALFYAGDPHAVQGDGEVSGTAIEQSMRGVFRFVLHKGETITNPRAETDTHYLLMGIDLDLDRAMREAVLEVVDFLVTEKGLSRSKAMSLASIAVDFRIGEVVDLTQVVVGYVPKGIFID